MISTLMALGLFVVAPPGASAQVAPSSATAVDDVPARVAEISEQLGPAKMARLVASADEFVDELARILVVLDRRQTELQPQRLPKALRAKLIAFQTSGAKLLDLGARAGDDLQAIAAWRLDTRLRDANAELARAKKGLGGLRSLLARLKARSVDPGAHYPLNLAYLRVAKNGELEDVREILATAAELDAGLQRVEAAIKPLIDHMGASVKRVNADQRARDILATSFAAMLAGLGSQG